MNGDERRKKIINILSSSKSPVAGVALAKELDVSRQVIVQDIALLRANGAAIFSTNRGYLIQADKQYSRVLKVIHEDDEVEEELKNKGFLAKLQDYEPVDFWGDSEDEAKA